MLTGHHMQILPTKKNMATEIIVVVAEAAQEKQPAELLPVLLQNKF